YPQLSLLAIHTLTRERAESWMGYLCAQKFCRTGSQFAAAIQVLQIQVLHRRPLRPVHAFGRVVSTRVYTRRLTFFPSSLRESSLWAHPKLNRAPEPCVHDQILD